MKSTLYQTRIDLPEDVRQPMIELLNQELADVRDLDMQSKQAHWNVKGPGFIALHELFDRAADEAEALTDDIAERVVALGGTARGAVQVVSRQSRLSPYPLDAVTGPEHLRAVADAVAHCAASQRAAIATAADAGDAGTADLFTGSSRQLDKLLWLIEAHLQGN